MKNQMGVWSEGFLFFINSGVQAADEAEMKLMASTPQSNHVYTVDSFDAIKTVQKEMITQVCSAVDEQLNSLVSGEEGEI